MKLHKKLISAISIFALLNSTASADKFVMKDGSVINGSIISQTSTSYLLRAEVTNNVYSEKTILKSDVSKIIKIDPSIETFKKLKTILPTPNLMEEKDYEAVIKTDLEPFIEKYPNSPHIEEAKSILDTLKKEQHIIKTGGVKLGGKILTSEQIDADRYNVSVAKEYHKFITYASKKQYRPALSTLERLEANYPDSQYTRKAQNTALTILPLYEEKLQKLYDGHETLLTKRERALQSMSSSDKNRTKKIFTAEEQRYQQLLDATKKNKKKAKWLPINSYFLEPIERNLKMIPSEIKRQKINIEKPSNDAGRIYRDTYAALGNGDYITAKENFDLFKRAKPPEELVTELEQKLKAAKSAMEAEKAQRKEEEALAKKQAAEERKKAKQAERDAKNNNKKNKKNKDSEAIEKKNNNLEKIKQ